jgi:hypothetical protein
VRSYDLSYERPQRQTGAQGGVSGKGVSMTKHHHSASTRRNVSPPHRWRVSAVSDLAKAMRYALRHWPGLVLFLDDGRLEMDTNVVERAIRPSVWAQE